ncbi:MAG: phosphate-starvation-inducible PsiE family protein, partial [Xanthobacteraceae bacterium]
VLQARPIVLITILVIARKVILLDFAATTFEQLVGIGAIALAFGLLFWLISARSPDSPESRSHD